MAENSDLVLCLRETADRKTADSWALVLVAAGIPCRLQNAHGVWHVLTAEADAERAREQLDAYERENPAREIEPAPVPEYGRTSGGFLVAAALVLFFLVTGPYARDTPWHARGAADAEAILGGEVWRTVTALTLHSDFAHVLANALSASLFATLVFRALGPGLGSGLILLAGASGNLLNAWVHESGHVSVGASTALFGAIGILSGLQFARLRRIRLRRRSAWLPLAGGLGLLAMLGTAGDRTDISAHLLGLGCGVPLGGLASVLSRPPRRFLQGLLAAAALGLVACAWSLALDHQTSASGRIVTSKVQAERGWCTMCQHSPAMSSGWQKNESGLSGWALRVQGTSITASIAT